MDHKIRKVEKNKMKQNKTGKMRKPNHREDINTDIWPKYMCLLGMGAYIAAIHGHG